MKVLLINLAEKQAGTVSPPIGLWSIEANLPFSVQVWDNAVNGDLWNQYIHHAWTDHVDILGVSARFSSQHDDMLTYVYSGRAFADKIYIGGAHGAYADIKWTRDRPPDEICTSGWGETFMRDKTGSGSLNLDNLNHPIFKTSRLTPYWDAHLPHDKTKTQRWIPIEFSRGCNQKCTFCCSPNYWGGLCRHSPEWIEDYLIYLKTLHHIEEVLIEDDAFDLRLDWAWEIIRLLNDHDIWWSTPNGLRARSILNLSPGQWDTLTHRCWRLSLPFETGSPSTAKLMRTHQKFLNWEEAQELTIRLRRRNIEVAGFFIIGYPGETHDDIRQTLAYANSLSLNDRYIYVATPYPGTELYSLALRKKYILSMKKPEFYKRLSYRQSLITTQHLTSSEVDQWRVLDQELAIQRDFL